MCSLKTLSIHHSNSLASLHRVLYEGIDNSCTNHHNKYVVECLEIFVCSTEMSATIHEHLNVPWPLKMIY